MIKQNLVKLYEHSFKTNWDLPSFTDYSENNTLYYRDTATQIEKLHIFFEKTGIKRGDKIALIGKDNSLWCIAYLATVTYGAVIVPILRDFHPDSIQHILNHSDSKLIFTSNQIWENLDDAQLPLIRGAISIENRDYTFLYQKNGENIKEILDSREKLLTEKYPQGYSPADVKYAEVDNSEVVLINYTSGTTGFSKGVMLTANNLAGNVTYAATLNILNRGENVLSFLPLAHTYGCAFTFLYAQSAGAHTFLLTKTPSPRILLQAFADVKPHLIVTVPLIIEKIYKKTILPKLSTPTMKIAMNIPIVKQKIQAKIREGLTSALGGRFSEVIIGGAAFNQEVESFLYQIKFRFTVGYGMTECAPLISYDHHYDFVPTSCGQILKDIMELRVDSPDPYNTLGEIQVRGENVMAGYYKNEEATKAAFTSDGWLKTGDLGTTDSNNRIYLRGRSKTMILGPSGQNIFPEEIEAKINNMPYVSESLVVLRNNKLVALVYPDYEAMDADGIDTGELQVIMDANKQELNKMVAGYENITAMNIYPTEFEKTPKKSIKRYLYEV
ncbi:long-chain acyl-CoA synthetase [Dysgonomonas sp. PH5-45]|uniref:AMP-binding protein n=1 Tax=unclassified Dysgonomonas TaxID=2630389 RepID=UPI002475547E|nr:MULTISPECIES: AMP-binding protein [unclassified Dysgonomonas]MDH6355281.1 long-chain acyl-CoA synthetase [Dysgonomonas sp. PH5-45]MDH6388193.1 long-chain acyl-CoA synthetase [Dysgonomonas sp. PH5-37]